jgi:hypothetical protein
MIQLTTKINHRTSGLVILICLVIFAIIMGYYWVFISSDTTPQNSVIPQNSNQVVEQRALRVQFFESVSTLKRYGNWPIVNVPLSSGRGNPFAPK